MNPEYQEALEALRLARNQFDYADEDHIDIACLSLSLAEKRVEVAIQVAKKNKWLDMF